MFNVKIRYILYLLIELLLQLNHIQYDIGIIRYNLTRFSAHCLRVLMLSFSKLRKNQNSWFFLNMTFFYLLNVYRCIFYLIISKRKSITYVISRRPTCVVYSFIITTVSLTLSLLHLNVSIINSIYKWIPKKSYKSFEK